MDFKFSTFYDYQQAALRTCPDGIDHEVLGLGLVGESGEVADVIKKYLGHGHTLDALEKELGDALWYVAVAAHECAVNIRPSSWTDRKDSFTLAHSSLALSNSCLQAAYAIEDMAAGTDLSSVIERNLNSAIERISVIASKSETSLSAVAGANIAKLYEAYPTGFSSERSLARDRA